MKRVAWIVLWVPTLAQSGLGQSDIDPANKYAWGENIGWLNWRHDRPNPGDGVTVAATFLGGFVWGENVGWINLGDADPGASGGSETSYANINGTDFGVNLDAGSGELTGYAWGENIGWINFSGGALATPPEPARLDPAECRFRGFVWGENVGWINLDDSTHFVALIPGACAACEPCDTNCDGSVNLFDIDSFVQQLQPGGPAACSPCAADSNEDGSVNLFDIADFVECLNG